MDLNQGRAIKNFLIQNCEALQEWYNAINPQARSELVSFDFKAETINALNFETEEANISEILKLVNCLAYIKGSLNKLAFGDLEVVLNSKYEYQIISLMILSLENLHNGVLEKIKAALMSNEIFALIANNDEDMSEMILNKETISSFTAYFSLIAKFSPEELRNPGNFALERVFKVTEMLMSYAYSYKFCIDEFFMFTASALKLYLINVTKEESNKVLGYINSLRKDRIHKLFENISKSSWNTISNALFLIEKIEIGPSTIKMICSNIDPEFITSTNSVLNFIISKVQNIMECLNYFMEQFDSERTEKSIAMLKWIMKALKLYIADINKIDTFDVFNYPSLDLFIKDFKVFSTFKEEIEDLVDFQLTSTNLSESFLNSYFETLSIINPKPLASSEKYAERLALYFYKSWSNKKYITDYLISLISQLSSIDNWSEKELLDAFTGFFSFIPEIKSEFNNRLDGLISTWNEEIALDFKKIAEPTNDYFSRDQKIQKVSLKSKLITSSIKIIELEFHNTAQFNFTPIKFFDDFIDSYIEIVRNEDIRGLFKFYLSIKENLKDFKIKEISYEDSKNSVTIAKYFLSLVKMSLEDIFINFQRRPPLKSAENENNIPLESIQNLEESKDVCSITKPNKIDASGLKRKIYNFNEDDRENLQLGIENLQNDSIEYADKYWTGYFNDAKIKITYIKEFRNSFLYKITFSIDDRSFILRQFLASHMTRLFNGTLKNVHNNFIQVAKQTTIKIHFNLPKILNKSQKTEFKIILRSQPVQDAFRVEGILNDNICKILENTYFASLPNNLSGLTVFGGTILLQQSLAEESELKSCSRKIAFIHEAAHALRKCKNGQYNPTNKTPKLNISLKIGMPGNEQSTADPEDKKEGGRIIENRIFGVFFTKMNKAQIEFLNNLSNWYLLNEKCFRAELAILGNQISQQYELARQSHYIAGIRYNDCEHY